MPLPPKGDPQRPLELAVRSVRLLAILLLLVSTCVGVVALPVLARGRSSKVDLIVGVVALLVYFAPGVTYLVLTFYLKARRAWAVTTAIVVASVQLLFTLLGVAGMAIQGPMNMIAIGTGTLVILALAQMIQQLSQSYRAVREWTGDTQRGFEPLPVRPRSDTDQ